MPVLKDCAYLTAPDSGASLDYSIGAIVGLVSGLMHCGKSFNDALTEVTRALPQNYREAGRSIIHAK